MPLPSHKPSLGDFALPPELDSALTSAGNFFGCGDYPSTTVIENCFDSLQERDILKHNFLGLFMPSASPNYNDCLASLRAKRNPLHRPLISFPSILRRFDHITCDICDLGLGETSSKRRHGSLSVGHLRNNTRLASASR